MKEVTPLMLCAAMSDFVLCVVGAVSWSVCRRVHHVVL